MDVSYRKVRYLIFNMFYILKYLIYFSFLNQNSIYSIFVCVRYLCTLKSYVRNRGRPEGSIAEGYNAEECLAFCSLYFDDGVETRHNRVNRNDDDIHEDSTRLDVFSNSGRPLGKRNAQVLDDNLLAKAHQYVLFNCEPITQFIE